MCRPFDQALDVLAVPACQREQFGGRLPRVFTVEAGDHGRQVFQHLTAYGVAGALPRELGGLRRRLLQDASQGGRADRRDQADAECRAAADLLAARRQPQPHARPIRHAEAVGDAFEHVDGGGLAQPGHDPRHRALLQPGRGRDPGLAGPDILAQQREQRRHVRRSSARSTSGRCQNDAGTRSTSIPLNTPPPQADYLSSQHMNPTRQITPRRQPPPNATTQYRQESSKSALWS